MGGVADFAGDLVGDVAGGLFGAEGAQDANRSATNAQLQGIRESNQLQRDLFNAQTGLNAYQRGIGNQALSLLAGMYGIQGGFDPAASVKFDENGKLIDVAGTMAPGGGSYGTGAPNYSAFLNSPDYLWALEQGQLGQDRAAAAGGNLFSGGRLKEAARYNQGMASQQLGNFQNRLASLAGIGTTTNNQLSNALQNTGNNISQGLMNMGATRASGYMNNAAIDQNARQNFFDLAVGGGQAAASAMAFSDRRLKSKIEKIGTHPSGLPWYRYEIFGQPSEGVMADEVMQVKPEAVKVHPSAYLMVDYGAL